MVGELDIKTISLLSLPVEIVRWPWFRLKENTMVLIKQVNRIVKRKLLGSRDKRWKFVV